MCWEKCHVLRTLKNPAVLFYRCRNLCAPPQEAKSPTLPTSSYFQWQSNFVDPIIFVSHPILHFIIATCSFNQPFHVHRLDIQMQLKYYCSGVKPQQSINQSYMLPIIRKQYLYTFACVSVFIVKFVYILLFCCMFVQSIKDVFHFHDSELKWYVYQEN